MIEHQEKIDFSRVPESKGMGIPTLTVVITGVIVIFIIGGMAIGFAGWGHMWPSPHTERMDLGTMPAAK